MIADTGTHGTASRWYVFCLNVKLISDMKGNMTLQRALKQASLVAASGLISSAFWIRKIRLIREIVESDIPALFLVRPQTRENAMSVAALASIGITQDSMKAAIKGLHRGLQEDLADNRYQPRLEGLWVLSQTWVGRLENRAWSEIHDPDAGSVGKMSSAI